MKARLTRRWHKLTGSMTNRIFLLLAAGVVLSILLTLELARREEQQSMQQLRAQHDTERVAQFMHLLNGIPAEVRPKIVTSSGHVGLRATLGGDATVRGDDDRALMASLRARLPADVQVMHASAQERCVRFPRSSDDRPFGPRPEDGFGPQEGRPDPGPGGINTGNPGPQTEIPCMRVDLQLSDATPVHIAIGSAFGGPPPFGPFAAGRPFPVHLLVFFALIAALAWVAARMVISPLRRLSRAASELGADIERQPLREEGPWEIRRAIAAFNTMQAQIRVHIQQRVFMLAAIAHDLQTPLTRIRLRLEKVENPELRAQLLNDLAAMQQLVREGLDFARSTTADHMQNLDLDSLLETVCIDAADAGQDVTLRNRSGVAIRANPASLQRCMTNLIDNAIKYGDVAIVSTERRGRLVDIRIEDHGPGLPDDYLDKVFEPFYRMESSRSRETGGVGLGLAIARNIVQRHGGNIRLENTGHGMVAIVQLPLAAA
ncbi:ATP-binding protein [Amantichitinum ursilacus]|nr:ATP-binding protein [Amantichitinum ursilacus]